jgi:hypothetical protein
LLLQLLVSQPRLPPNMSRIAKQMQARGEQEAAHELEASLDVAILMTMISMMKAVVEEAEADTPIPSIVLHDGQGWSCYCGCSWYRRAFQKQVQEARWVKI